MGGPPDRITAFLRHGADVLLVRGADGRWDGLSRPVADDPDAALRSLLAERVPAAADAEIVRLGPPVPVRTGAGTYRRHGALVAVEERAVQPADREATVWTRPLTLRYACSVRGGWRAYRGCGPRLETVRDDETHGSTYVSLRALEALRDLAVDAAARADGRRLVREQARALATCRPELVAVGVRIDRVMASGSAAPAAVARRCDRVVDAASRADDEAARSVRSRLADAVVLTLSRSGTVATALRRGDPAAVWILESRPGREGVRMAETVADAGTPVTLAVDAAAAHLLEREAVDIVLVGADAIGPDGAVRNKVGTRTLARAAAAADVPVHVVAATDKVSPTPVDAGPAGPTAPVYDGDREVGVSYPLFDRTPADVITAVHTETGTLETAAVRDIARRHRERRQWRADPE